MALYTINGIVPTNATKVVIQGLTNGNFLKVDEMCLQVTACNPDNANAPPFCTPTPAACTGNTFKWSQIIDAINGNPSAVRLFCGGTLSYLIPGPYPPAFSGPVSVAIPDAVGWDGYIGRDVVTQPNERWRLVFKKSGSVVYSSNYTNDVPDFKSQAYWRGSLGTGFLPNGADQIFIEHWSVGHGKWSIQPSTISPSNQGNCVQASQGEQNKHPRHGKTHALDQSNEQQEEAENPKNQTKVHHAPHVKARLRFGPNVCIKLELRIKGRNRVRIKEIFDGAAKVKSTIVLKTPFEHPLRQLIHKNTDGDQDQQLPVPLAVR